jgi:DNA-binding beta-propeller fold protein YncE
MMTKHKQLILISGTLFFLCFSSIASAAVQKGISKNIKTEGKPLDIAISSDGQKTFVLLEGGIVQILGGNGKPQGTIEVSKSVVSIDTSPNGETLLLADKDNSLIRVVALAYHVDINIEGSPFKGPADAPIVIAEFSCFQ